MGGKGYKPYTSLTGKKVSGDWEDSDRGSGNKAKKRAGGEVKAKSPTYLAHVKNKKKKGHNCASKVKHEEYGIGNCIKEMHTLDENGNVTHYDVMFSNRIIKNVPSSSLEVLEGMYHEHYVNEEKNKENFTPHKMIDPSTKKVYMANTYDEHMKYQKMGYVHEENKPKKKNCGCGQDPCITYGKQEKVDEAKKNGEKSKGRHPRDQKELERAQEYIKKNPNFGKVSEAKDAALDYVINKYRKKYGKDAVITKDNPIKPPSEAQKKKNAAERKKRQDADNKAFAARAKKAGYKNPQDYANVVARYGSEDNYNKGRGLGT